MIQSVGDPENRHFLDYLMSLASLHLMLEAHTHIQNLDAAWANRVCDTRLQVLFSTTAFELLITLLQGVYELPPSHKNASGVCIEAMALLLSNIKGVIRFHHGLHSSEDLSPLNTLLSCPPDELKGLVPAGKRFLGLAARPTQAVARTSFTASFAIVTPVSL